MFWRKVRKGQHVEWPVSPTIARIIDENIDGAANFGFTCRNALAHRLQIGDIKRLCDSLATSLADGLGLRFCPFGDDIVDDDCGTLPGKERGDPRSGTLPSASYQRNFSRK